MAAGIAWEQCCRRHERPIFQRIDDAYPYGVYLDIGDRDDSALMLLSSKAAPDLPELKTLNLHQKLPHAGTGLPRAKLVGGNTGSTGDDAVSSFTRYQIYESC